MRLLDTETLRFVDVINSNTIKYAILSHRWDPSGEQTYQDLKEIQKSYPIQTPTQAIQHVSTYTLDAPTPRDSTREASIWNDPRLSDKIRRACAVARARGYRLLWIDSCCIDKTSSSELSESINSMFRWYRDAAVCYAFLADVPSSEDPLDETSRFRRSEWFRRGWTLQELIAPRVVIFLSDEWRFLGTKSSLELVVEKVTRIDRRVLTHRMRLDEVSVAQRMSWASDRVTTKEEDEAYSLLGIFDINIPTLYGEGRRAFLRLQEEIMKRIPDQSIFAWGSSAVHSPLLPPSDPGKSRPLVFGRQNGRASFFADSPADFKSSGPIRPLSHREFAQRLGVAPHAISLPDNIATPHGVRTRFPLLYAEDYSPQYTVDETSRRKHFFVLLACEPGPQSDDPENARAHLIAITCMLESQGVGDSIMKATTLEHPLTRELQRVITLSSSLIDQEDVRTGHIVYMPIGGSPETVDPEKGYSTLVLADWCGSVFAERGYAFSESRVVQRCALFVVLAKGPQCLQIAFGGRWPTYAAVEGSDFYHDVPVWFTSFPRDELVDGAVDSVTMPPHLDGVASSPPDFALQLSAPGEGKDVTCSDSAGRYVTMRFGWTHGRDDPTTVVFEMEILREHAVNDSESHAPSLDIFSTFNESAMSDETEGEVAVGE